MRRAIALLSALALVLTGAVPAEATHTRKGRPKCSKVVKRDATGRKVMKKVCRKPTRRASARRPAAKPGPTVAQRPTAVAPVRTIATSPPAAELQPAPGGPDAPAAAPAGPPVGAAPACDPSPWLGTRAEDANGAFRLVLTRGCVPAGTVRVQLVNRDLQPHNVYVQGLEPAVAPRAVVGDVDGETTGTGAVDLAPGRWRFYCAIEGHESMTGTVTATG
jgi:hypothetical protein